MSLEIAILLLALIFLIADYLLFDVVCTKWQRILISALIASALYQFGGYVYLGYLDPFFIVAFFISLICVLIAGSIIDIFVMKLKSGRK